MASKSCLLLALVLVGPACADDPAQSANESPIADPTPAAPDELLSIVKVNTWRGLCSGTLIATDTVLTAAHCFCTEPYFATPVCKDKDTTVVFRPNPPATSPVTRAAASVVTHPDFYRSKAHRSLLNDLALVHLAQPAPSYVPTIDVAKEKYPSGKDSLIAGYGDTGSHCQHQLDGSLNFDIVGIDEYRLDDTVIFFDDEVWCGGDSGGAILDLNATTIYGVISNVSWELFHGFVNNAMSVAAFFDWIKANTCSDVLEDRCSSKGGICRCNAGEGDCDTDADCKDGLHCAQDVGSQFGFPPDTDVCVPSAGPPEGTCKCRNSGLNNLCVSSSGPNDTFPNDAFEDCSATYHAVCNPTKATQQDACGVCTCEH